MTMAMLIIAVSLIVSGTSCILDNEPDVARTDIRKFQTNRIGSCILEMKEERSPLDESVLPEDGHSFFIWNGENITRWGSNSSIDAIIMEVITWTPDMTWSIVILERDGTIIPDNHDFCEWRWEFMDGTSITVILPRNRDPLPCLEGYDC